MGNPDQTTPGSKPQDDNKKSGTDPLGKHPDRDQQGQGRDPMKDQNRQPGTQGDQKSQGDQNPRKQS